MKINNKYSLSIPKAVRLASHSRIISEYIKMCKSNDLESISESYCSKILKECSASHSKNLQGLDNMFADGLDAFDKLINILNTLKDLSFENLDLENLEVILKLKDHRYIKILIIVNYLIKKIKIMIDHQPYIQQVIKINLILIYLVIKIKIMDF